MLKPYAQLLLLAAIACGGATKSTAPVVTTPSNKLAIDAFHDALAPLWHSPDSPDRTEKTCAAVPTLEARAQELGDAPLVESVHALGADCGSGRTDFQTKFAAVHTAFHAAMEKSGADHHE